MINVAKEPGDNIYLTLYKVIVEDIFYYLLSLMAKCEMVTYDIREALKPEEHWSQWALGERAEGHVKYWTINRYDTEPQFMWKVRVEYL